MMSESAELLLERGPYAPSEAFRLPLSWSRDRAAELRSRVDPDGRTGVLLLDPWNIVYFTGLWALSTERLLAAYLPADGSDPVWFYPHLDHDLITSWWFGDGDAYFDTPIADGQYPPAGSAIAAARGGAGSAAGADMRTADARTAGVRTVDDWEWLFSRLRARGYRADGPEHPGAGGERFAIDIECSGAARRAATRFVGGAPRTIGGIALGMRTVKTGAELALWARAYDYFDAVHVYARDRILERDPALTDSRLRLDMADWVLERIMHDYGPDRSPHGPVGISIDLGWVRAGAVTGYPHPNQVRHAVIEQQRTIQVSGIVQLGGCGGELYRPYLLRTPTSHERRLWEAARDSCLVLRDALRAGRTGAEAAQDVHRFQAGLGVAPYAATRPSHGQGMEGHQPPYISLGEQRVLEPGMCFSVEPGLYDPEKGFGVNFSDTFVVQEHGPAVQLSRLPWSEEWAWLG